MNYDSCCGIKAYLYPFLGSVIRPADSTSSENCDELTRGLTKTND